MDGMGKGGGDAFAVFCELGVSERSEVSPPGLMLLCEDDGLGTRRFVNDMGSRPAASGIEIGGSSAGSSEGLLTVDVSMSAPIAGA